MADQSSGDRPQAKLDMLGRSQTANIGTVDTRVVGGNMYTSSSDYHTHTHTTLNYTTVLTVPRHGGTSSGTTPDGRLFPWGTMELRTLLQRILRPFWMNSLDAGSKSNFLLSNLDEHSGKLLPQKTPGEVYVSAMLHAGKGLPCWKPRPRKPTQDGVGVLIGDVGIFSVEGGFRKIFNLWDDEESVQAYLSSTSDDTGNTPYGVPPKPQPFVEANELVMGESVARGAWSETIYEPDDQTIARFEFHHLESHQQGAVLAMTSAGKLEELDEGDKLDLREFLSQHAGHIFAYANSIRPIDDHEALYIISGCIKSETWGLAGFTDPVRHPLHVPRLVRMSETPNGDDPHRPLQPTFAWRSLGTFDAYVGRSGVAGSQDQALFFRGFKLDFSQAFRSQAKRKRTFMGGRGPVGGGGSSQSPGSGEDRLGDGTGPGPNEDGSNESPSPAPGRPQGGGGPSPSTGGTRNSQNDSHIVLTSFPDDSNQELFHPCDIINRVLLMKTGADFSLSHDDDWAYLVGKCTVPVRGDQGNRHNEPAKLRSMDEHEVAQLCAISVRYGAASLYLEELAPGSFAEEGRALPTAQLNEDSGHLNDLVEPGRPVAGKTPAGEGVDVPLKMTDLTAREVGTSGALYTVYEGGEETPRKQQVEQDLEEERFGRLHPQSGRKRDASGKSTSEHFIIVRPPPSKSNHPLNLQIQLVPAQPLQAQPMSYNPVHASSAETLVSSYDASSATSTLISSSTAPERGPRRIVPLYNLQAHNVLANTIMDAGTDAKIAKFLKRGIELADLAVFEPVEIWSPKNASGKKQAKDRATHLSVGETGSAVLMSPANLVRQPKAESPDSTSHTETPLKSSQQIEPDLSRPPLQEVPPTQPPAPSRDRVSSRSSTDSSGLLAQVPVEPQQRFASLRRWLSTSRSKPPKAQPGVDVITVSDLFMQPGTLVYDSHNAYLSGEPERTLSVNHFPRPTSLPLPLRPPILGTQAAYLPVSDTQTEEILSLRAINGGTQGDAGDREDFDSVLEDYKPWRGKDSTSLKVGSIFDGASMLSETSSLTLVGSSIADFSGREQASDKERAEIYVWLAVKWLKKRTVPPPSKGRLQRGLSRISQQALGQQVGERVEVRFEWTRTRSKRGNGKVDTKGLIDDDGGDDENEDPEDEEALWVCTLQIRKVEYDQVSSDPGAVDTPMESQAPVPTHSRVGETGGSGSQEGKGEKPPIQRLRVGVISPTPHHPKVVAQLQIPFSLPDLEVDRMRLVRRKLPSKQAVGDRADSDEPYYGLTLTAEEIKDIVCSTGLWLVVRERMGGVGNRRQTFDGWKIREFERAVPM